MSLLSETKCFLKQNNLESKYSFGQNFLIDQNIIDKIIDFSNISPNDKILEIGPGIGSLTKSLLKKTDSVCVIEKDSDMVSIIKSRFRCKVINGDAMDIHVCADKLIANLPYNVAAPLIITHVEDVNMSVVMVQKEIADRIFAKPCQKNYGAYTVKLSMFAKPIDRFKVSSDNFYPKPRVESSVIKLITNVLPEAQVVCMIADIVFAHRRKTIYNNIKLSYKSSDNALLYAMDEFLKNRAEELSINQYVNIARKYKSFQA